MSAHVFAARRGGHGVCAFCPFTEADGDHRPLTEDERAAADAIMATMDEILDGVYKHR